MAMAKQTTPDQHRLLEAYWGPRDCCLCNHEAEIARLEGENRWLKTELAKHQKVEIPSIFDIGPINPAC